MLAINNICSTPSRYLVLNQNKKIEPQTPENNVSFTGNNKIAKRVGIGLLAILSALGLYSCNGDNPEKEKKDYIEEFYNPDSCHNVILKGEGVFSDKKCIIKMEDGCSFEGRNIKYVMHDGQLCAYDKHTHKLRKVPNNVMELRESQMGHLLDMVGACNEEDEKDIKVLSKADIKYIMDNAEEFDYDKSENPTGRDIDAFTYRRISSKNKPWFYQKDDNKVDIYVNGGYYYNGYHLRLGYDDDKDINLK